MKKVVKITESQYNRLILNEQCSVPEAIAVLSQDGNYNITKKGSQSEKNQLLNKCLKENPFIKGFFDKISKNNTVKMKVIPKGYDCYIAVEPKSVPPNKDSIWINIHSDKTIHVMYEFATPKKGIIKNLWYRGKISGDNYSDLKLVKPVDKDMGDVASDIIDLLRVNTKLMFGDCGADVLLKNNYGIPSSGNIMNNIVGKMHTSNFTNKCKTI